MKMHVSAWEAFLFAVVDGEINAKAVEQMMKLASSIASKRGISKILIDASRMTGTLSADERVELGERLGDHIKRAGSSPNVALVGHPPTTDGLGVLAARGRGVNVMRFNSIQDGLKWLRRAHVNEKDLIHAAPVHASVKTAHHH